MGLVRLGNNSPSVHVLAVRKPRAATLGWYPSSRAASRMRSRVAAPALAFGWVLSTLETRLASTPARLATSRSFGRGDRMGASTMSAAGRGLARHLLADASRPGGFA